MRTFLNFFVTLLCFYLWDGVSTAHADPISALAAISGFFSSLGVVGKLLLTIGLSIGQTLLQKALAKKKEEGPRGVTLEVKMGDDIPVSAVLGTYATAGKRKYIGCWGTLDKTPNGFLVDVLEIGNLPVGDVVALWINDKKVTLSKTDLNPIGTGYPIAEFKDKNGTPFAWWKFYDGTQTTADPYLLAKFKDDPDHPYKATMIGRGCPYIILTYRLSEKFWGNSLPSALIVTNGKPLYDPRKDSSVGGSGSHRWGQDATYEPSDNPYVQIYNIARGLYFNGKWFYGGQNVPAKWLPVSAFIAAMQACSALRTLADGSRTPSFRSGVEFQGTDEPLEIIDQLRAASNGRIVEIGGKLKPYAGELPAAEVTFTDADVIITEAQSFEPFPNLDDTHNGATATYPEPKEKWASKDAPPYYVADLEAKDGQRRLVADLQFPAAPYPVQVQALMRAAIEEARRFRTHQFQLPPIYWVLEPGDVVAWSSALMGYSNKKFTVVSIEGELTYNQFVTLREVDPLDYSWSTSFEAPVFTTLPGPIVLPTQVIDGWAVTPSSVKDANSDARRPAILVEVAPDLDDVRSIRIQIRHKVTGELVHDQRYPYVMGETYSWLISGNFLIGGEAYEVRGLPDIMSTRDVDWTPWTSVTMFNLLIGTKDVLNDAITAQKILDASITASKIMDAAINSLKLADQAVSTAKLQVAAVTAQIIADQAVNSQKLADGAVSVQKMAAGLEPVTIISGTTVPTTKSTTNISVNGTLYTWDPNSNAYKAGTPGPGSITATQIADGAISTPKLAANVVTADKLGANSVTAASVAAGAITAVAIAAQSIGASKVIISDANNLVPDNQMADIKAWTFAAGVWQQWTDHNLFARSYNGFRYAGDGINPWGTGGFSSPLQSMGFPIQEGQSYRCIGTIYSSNVHYALLRITFLNQSNGVISFVDFGNTGLGATGGHDYNTVVTAPTGARLAIIECYQHQGNSQGPAYFGGISVNLRNAAALIVDGGIIADMLSANSVTAAKIAALSITAAMLQANSVTAAAIAASSITGDKIAANTIGANQIAAGAITAKQLVLTDFDNLVPNGSFEQPGVVTTDIWNFNLPGDSGWYLESGNQAGQNGSTYLVIYRGAAANQNVNMSLKNRVPCKAGDVFALSLMALGGGGAGLYVRLQFFNTGGGLVSEQTIYENGPAPGGLTRIAGQLTAPAGTAYVTPIIYCNGNIGQYIVIDDIRLTRAYGGELIVDGSIVAGKIAANSISSGMLQSNAITADKIAASSISTDKLTVGGVTVDILAQNASSKVYQSTDTSTLTGISSSFASVIAVTASRGPNDTLVVLVSLRARVNNMQTLSVRTLIVELWDGDNNSLEQQTITFNQAGVSSTAFLYYTAPNTGSTIFKVVIKPQAAANTGDWIIGRRTITAMALNKST